MNKLKRSIKTTFFSLVFAIVFIAFVFGLTKTYAWFSSLLMGLDGNLNLGSLSGIVRIYENYDDSDLQDSFEDGLTDAHAIASLGSSIEAYSLIEKPWYSNSYTSVYMEIQNTGTIDLKSIFKLTYSNQNVETFLSYYYYQLVDITSEVNAYGNSLLRENISAYNQTFQNQIADSYETYMSNVISYGSSVTSSLAFVQMGETSVGSSSIYRLDIALSEIPTDLIVQYDELTQTQKQIKVSGSITLKQTNAPDDDNQDSGLSIYVSSADSFINAINSASNGDTIYLSANISVARNVTITHRVNIVLNGYTLSISGNLAYDTANTGSITLNVSGSVLNVLGSLNVDTPNATFRILGSGGAAQSIFLGSRTNPNNTGDFYVNALRDANNSATYGFYQYGVSIMRVLDEAVNTLATMRVASNTRVTIGVGSVSGPIVSVDGARNIEVYNQGEIQSIDFSKMAQANTSNTQIYIFNRSRFTNASPAILLPTWSLGWKSKEIFEIANLINTRVINAPGSDINYSVSGSSVFTNIDIENGDTLTDFVIDLGQNIYRVNIQLDNMGFDTYTLRYILTEFFENNHNNATEEDFENWLTTVDGLKVYTYNAAVLKRLDFVFLSNYTTSLQLIDLENAKLENDTIPDSAFSGLRSLSSVVLPTSQLFIGQAAFSGTSLQNITLTSSIASIGTNAFDIDTRNNGLLHAFYIGETITNLMANISGLNSTKTLLFMSPENLDAFKARFALTDTWYINSYANYDFIGTNSAYYRIIDGNSVELVYYGGNWSELIVYNTVFYGTSMYNVVAISQSAFRRSIQSGGTTRINLNFPNNVTRIKSDAFYGAYISNLSLNRITYIGAYAFKNASIQTSSARPEAFIEMSHVGNFAFEGATIGIATTNYLLFVENNTTNGQIKNSLNLRGNYVLGDGVFNSANLYGVVLNLERVENVTYSMTTNLSLYGVELVLNYVKAIGESAFEFKFKNYEILQEFNKVSALEVNTIGRLAFRGMYLQEFNIGIKNLYTTQAEVNSGISYGGSSSGVFYSDFSVTNLNIDGMLPSLNWESKTFLFGTEVGARTYGTVTIKNTNGLIYDYMFYSGSPLRPVVMANLNLHDVTSIGQYAFHYGQVTNVNLYHNGELFSSGQNNIQSVGQYAFRYSSVPSFGTLNLVNVGQYAFANTVIPASSIVVNGAVGYSAFANSTTTNVQNFEISGDIGGYMFSGATIENTEEIYLSGLIEPYAFANAYLDNLANIIFEDSTLDQYLFSNSLINGEMTIQTLGINNIGALAFYGLDGDDVSLNLTNALTISSSALKGVNIKDLHLGNSTFYSNRQGTFRYGDNAGGIFTDEEEVFVENLYIDGELPIVRQGTHVLGGDGADINIGSLFISSNVSRIPANTFYSTSAVGRVRIDTVHIESQNLNIGSYAFMFAAVNSFVFDAVAGNIVFGTYSFANTVIGNFEDFTYYSTELSKTVGVVSSIGSYAFQYARFLQDSDLSLFSHVNAIASHIFDNAIFELSSEGNAVSFDFSNALSIGNDVFQGVSSALGTITLGNSAYFAANDPNYYYGNVGEGAGIFASSGTTYVDEIVIKGNMPNTSVYPEYQTRVLGSNNGFTMNIGKVTVMQGVTHLPQYVFAGISQVYKTNITRLDILATNLTIKDFAFSYTNIINIYVYSSNMILNTKAFEYTTISNFNYDATAGMGQIEMASGSLYVFQNAQINAFNGFIQAGAGAVKDITEYAFSNATFGQDADLSWIGFVESIGSYAFSRTMFTKTSGNQFVSLDLRNVITIGDAIFEFIPNRLQALTIGNSSYNSLHGNDYTYGYGSIGMLYAAGLIGQLNIVGNLPNNNSYLSLGNSCYDAVWAVRFGEVNVAAGVTTLAANLFATQFTSVKVSIDTLNLNASGLLIGNNTFKDTILGNVYSNGNNLSIGAGAFSNTIITLFQFIGTSVDFGANAFNGAVIQNLTYVGSTAGALNMTGTGTFRNASINNITNFTFNVGGTIRSVISTISAYGFENAVFASGVDVSFIQYASRIEAYAFSRASFHRTQTNDFVNLDLTRVLSIGENAFYQMAIGLGTVTVGNSSYTSNPQYAYGNGVEGIFNGAGSIQNLIIAGNLPTTAYPFGNRSTNLLFATSYNVVQITASVTSLPKGCFAGVDPVYATSIGTLYINSTSIAILEESFFNTSIQLLNIPNATTFNGIGANAFKGANITTIIAPNTITVTTAIGDYALYGLNLNSLTLNVSSVTYIGAYAFANIIYNKSLVFNASLSLANANYMFADATLLESLTFNSVQSVGSNMFYGLISGNNVNYTFNFAGTTSISTSHPFAYMNGGGSVNLTITNLGALNSDYAFYSSTNIRNLTFDTSVTSLNGNNIFQNASNLVTILISYEVQPVIINATITTIPSATKVYVPGNLLNEYLMHQYWSLIANQISTTFNIGKASYTGGTYQYPTYLDSGDYRWGFYIIQGTTNAALVRYLGTNINLEVPRYILYDSATYTVTRVEGSLLDGTSVTNVRFPNIIQYIDINVFSNTNVTSGSFNTTYSANAITPFVFETEGNNKLIYESTAKRVLLKYFSSNTATTYTFPATVIGVGEYAFYNVASLQTINALQGNIQTTSNLNQYNPTYVFYLTFGSNAISNNPALTTLNIRNDTSGYGVILNSYAISKNPALRYVYIWGFANTIGSYAINENPNLERVYVQRLTNYAFGKGKLSIYTSTDISPYAFFGSGKSTGTVVFYITTANNTFFSNAFTYSRFNLFEFDFNPTASGHGAVFYNANAFETGMELETDSSGNVVQIFNQITIRVQSGTKNFYTNTTGRLAYYGARIFEVSSFTHTL